MELKLKLHALKPNLRRSRQTISNWETEKTYPDIISVVKMSDLYNVSLDLLLKGESAVSMLIYGKEANNRKQEIDRQHHTIPNQRS